MTDSTAFPGLFDLQTVLDSMGQGVLIFDADDRLVLDNTAARALLGANLILVRAEGWRAAAMLLTTGKATADSIDAIRAKALRQLQPIQFDTFLSGAYTHCWVSAITNDEDSTYTLITIEHSHWSMLTEPLNWFRTEMRTSIASTRGHADLIKHVLANRKPTTTADRLANQITGFTGLISTHMFRLDVLMTQLQRLEAIRTGQLHDLVRQRREAFNLLDFLEDFLEDASTTPLVEDPAPGIDYRDIISVDIPGDITVVGNKTYLAYAFGDLLRNSIMYSPPHAPIAIRATTSPRARSVQIDVTDKGYGIREKEAPCVFIPFERARQPQIIAEFGYGLSLYLVKMELEAMGGGIWFTSEEGLGTTFSFKLQLATPS